MISESYIIHETIDYDRFSLSSKNRPVKEKHVLEMMDAIREKNFLHVFPIVVSLDWVVLDGQHRLSAAKRLGVPIYFTFVSNMTIDDVPGTNTLQDKWNGENYLNHFVERGFKEYIILRSFWREFPWMKLASAIDLCHFGDRKHHKSQLADGAYTANDIEFGRRVALACLDFKPYITYYNESVFVVALRNLHSNSLYNHERMVRKLKFASGKMKRCTDVEMYISMLSEIYNYREPEESRCELRKVNPSAKNFRLDKKGESVAL